MSRTDRHRKIHFLEGYTDNWRSVSKAYWRWWWNEGSKHYGRSPASKVFNSKFFDYSRAKQKRFWQRDIDNDLN